MKESTNKQKTEHWSTAQERGAEWGVRFMLAIYRTLGRPIFSLFLYPIMGYFFLTGRTARRASMDYLNQLYRVSPECFEGRKPGLRLSFLHFLNFGQALLDKFSSWMGHVPLTEVNVRYGQVLNELVATRQGAVFLGSHLGNIEMCRALASLNYEVKINALILTDNAEKFNRFMRTLNPQSEVNLIQVSQLGPDTAILLKDKVDQGEFVVIVGDRTSATQPGRSHYVDFLGEPAPFPEGAFILAGLLNCPVYLLFCIKERKTYNVYLEHFSDSLKLPRAQRQQQLQEVIGRYADRLGFYCRKAPLQWFNFFDFWHRDDAVERKS